MKRLHTHKSVGELSNISKPTPSGLVLRVLGGGAFTQLIGGGARTLGGGENFPALSMRATSASA